jgi:hypothetical protein
MKYKINWSGLADENYWKYIAQFCVPSWPVLPGEKYIVTNSETIKIPGINIVDWSIVPDNNANFLKLSKKLKTLNFWRKMQSQVWALKNLIDCDILILLDTDVEIINFNEEKFEKCLDEFISSGLIWATGESQQRKLDAGHIFINTKHPDLTKLIHDYEDYWNSGKIFTLAKSYDGHVVEDMFKEYSSFKIKNRDYGSGMHVYDIGTVHWGSKEPKLLRAEWKGDGKSLVDKRLSEIEIKKYKNDTAQST